MSSAELRTLPTSSIQDALAEPGAVFVDLRSPSEFEADHVPGAHSIRLFDDEERALIGTLYSRSSHEIAFDQAVERTQARIDTLVREVSELVGWAPPEGDLSAIVDSLTRGGIRELEERLEGVTTRGVERPVYFYCWRGGLRSKSVTALFQLLGFERAIQIEGGYKAYRAGVMSALAGWQSPPAIALRGGTGMGKTLVLRAIERLRPGWTLDLEGAAGHRSSILGMVGLEPVSQRRFESRLFERLRRGFADQVVVFEGESRKIGDSIQPERVWEALQGARNVRLTTPTERRIEVLSEDYLAQPENRMHLAQQLPFIENRLGPKKYVGVLVEMLHADRIDELVRILLEEYYDPLYDHSEKGRDIAAEFDSTDPEACARELVAWIEGSLVRG